MSAGLRKRTAPAAVATTDGDPYCGSSGDEADADSPSRQSSNPFRLPSLDSIPHMPSRLRQILSDPSVDIYSRICRDVVIRLPLVGGTGDDALALAEHFGPVEYVNRGGSAGRGISLERERMLRSFGVVDGKTKNGGSGAETVEMAGVGVDGSASPPVPQPRFEDVCHYVRFSDGRDAMRCYLQLNGTVIDPSETKRRTEELHQLLEEECHTLAVQAAAENAPNSGESTETLRALKDFMQHPDATPQCADPGATVVVVTCDFFRSAFLESFGAARTQLFAQPTTNARGPASRAASGGLQWFRDRMRLRNSRGGWGVLSEAKSGSASTPSPVKRHQQALYRSSVELEQAFHRLNREGSAIPWPEFAFAVNYFQFLFDHDGTQLTFSPNTGVVCVCDVVAMCLSHCNGDLQDCLAWMDVADSEVELWSGNRPMRSSLPRQDKSRPAALRHSRVVTGPRSPAHKVGVLVRMPAAALQLIASLAESTPLPVLVAMLVMLALIVGLSSAIFLGAV